jgi:hypothetical protein
MQQSHRDHLIVTLHEEACVCKLILWELIDTLAMGPCHMMSSGFMTYRCCCYFSLLQYNDEKVRRATFYSFFFKTIFWHSKNGIVYYYKDIYI